MTHGPGVVAAALGLAAVAGGLWLLATRGVTASDGLVARPAIASAVLVLAGVVAWVVGLRLA